MKKQNIFNAALAILALISISFNIYLLSRVNDTSKETKDFNSYVLDTNDYLIENVILLKMQSPDYNQNEGKKAAGHEE
jgi:hypothetical protein